MSPVPFGGEPWADIPQTDNEQHRKVTSAFRRRAVGGTDAVSRLVEDLYVTSAFRRRAVGGKEPGQV